MRVMSKTTYDYAEASSLHAIAYIFNRKLGVVERLAWFAIWLVACLYCFLSVMTLYQGWQNNLVLTTVKTTGMLLRANANI